MPVERVTVIKGDTAQVARGAGTYGSKSTQIGGVAARAAAEQVVETAKRLAAEQLEADPRDMVLDAERGRFHVTGAPEPSLDWAALASALDTAGRLGRADRAERLRGAEADVSVRSAHRGRRGRQ